VKATDIVFAGSIPEIYDRCLGPFLFEPYAADLAERAAALAPSRILETAAGTGIVTAALARALPGAEILATDLNPAMLAVAAGRLSSPRVSFAPADAQSLPFEDGGFDLVFCQFGAMFFPDRVAAYREALRVLRPGGAFLFNVWDRIEANPASRAVADAVAGLFPGDPPGFLGRVPFGYHDKGSVESDLRAAGFTSVEAETVARLGAGAERDAAVGLCQGSPLRAEIEARDAGRLVEATEAAAAAVAALGEQARSLSAHVFTARG
jgi:SAM-dependent methyltransferase